MNGLYTIKVNGETRGPFTETQLRSMWGSGGLTADAHFARQGEDDWHPLAELCDPPHQAHPTAPTIDNSQPTAKPSTARKNFQWSAVFKALVIIAFIYLLYASDGCQHDPELPYISKGSLDAPVSLRSSEFPKITGGANFYQSSFSADLYNGTDWTVSRVDVIITNKSESRRFRLSPPETAAELDSTTMKVIKKKIDPAPAKPYSKGRFEAEVGDFLKEAKQGDWSWKLVEVFGFRQ